MLYAQGRAVREPGEQAAAEQINASVDPGAARPLFLKTPEQAAGIDAETAEPGGVIHLHADDDAIGIGVVQQCPDAAQIGGHEGIAVENQKRVRVGDGRGGKTDGAAGAQGSRLPDRQHMHVRPVPFRDAPLGDFGQVAQRDHHLAHALPDPVIADPFEQRAAGHRNEWFGNIGMEMADARAGAARQGDKAGIGRGAAHGLTLSANWRRTKARTSGAVSGGSTSVDSFSRAIS